MTAPIRSTREYLHFQTMWAGPLFFAVRSAFCRVCISLWRWGVSRSARLEGAKSVVQTIADAKTGSSKPRIGDDGKLACRPFDEHEHLDSEQVIVGGVFITVGVLIAVAGFIWLINTAVFVVMASKAPGVIVKVEKGEKTKHPIFTFTAADGIRHTQRAKGDSGFSYYGDAIEVVYDGAVPKDSKIDSFRTLWLWPTFVAGFGLIWVGITGYWLLIYVRSRRLGFVNSAA